MVQAVLVTGILDRQTHPELDTWRMLLTRILDAIANVEQRTGSQRALRIGGGTVLSALWGHRYSKDVDLFTHDIQMIAHLRPYLDDGVAAVLGTDYEENANTIRFREYSGSIDVIAATDILPDARPTIETFAGRRIEVENPAEIIAKKIFHRGNQGTVRDYIDLAEGMRRLPNLATRLRRPLAGKLPIAIAVLTEMSAAQLISGLSRVRFIGQPPAPETVRRDALAAMRAILMPTSYTVADLDTVTDKPD